MHAVADPPSVSSKQDEMPAAAPGVGFSGPQGVSPPRPGPMYQAGELSHYEGSFENGAYERETEEKGFMPPPPPMMEAAGQVANSQPLPYPGYWGFYPYYDYMFLTGQYPPGTVSHASSSYVHGQDSWHDSHYVRDYAPRNPGSAKQLKTSKKSAAPQSIEAPAQPVRGYRQGNAPASPGTAVQPGLWHKAGGFNVKVC